MTTNPKDLYTPGDIVAFKTAGIFAVLIRFGQRRKAIGLFRAIASYFTKRYADQIALCDYTHIGILASSSPPTCVQAVRHVDQAPLEAIAKGRPYLIISLPASINRNNVVAMAREYVGEEYGVLSILSLAFRALVPLKFSFRDTRTVICSALGAICLQAGGYLRVWPDLYSVMPYEIVKVLTS